MREDDAEGSDPLHILVVDDEPAIREIMKVILSLDGHRVTTAADGRAALAHMRDRTVHLVVTDFAMPGVNGLELITAVRQRRPEVPIIFMTGSREELVLREAIDRGAYRVLSKPVGPREVLRVVRTCMGRTGVGVPRLPNG